MCKVAQEAVNTVKKKKRERERNSRVSESKSVIILLSLCYTLMVGISKDEKEVTRDSFFLSSVTASEP